MGTLLCSHADNMPFFSGIVIFRAVPRRECQTRLSADLFSLGMNEVYCKETLLGEEALHLWIAIIDHGSEVVDKGLQKSGIMPHSPTHQLLMYRLMNYEGRQMY